MALMIGSVLGSMDVLGEPSGVGLELIFALPIAVVEVTLAMWLIIKGFNQSALLPPLHDGLDAGWDGIGASRSVVGSVGRG